MEDKIRQLADILSESDNIVFFGGAGVSTASNIPDFRSSTGLYSRKLNRNFTPEQAVSHSFFMQYPEEFFDFYKKNLVYPDAKPNDCHTALAQLEEMGKLKAVVTQNIDGLHQAAGSKNVLELHGSVLRNYCEDCKSLYDVHIVSDTTGIPKCPKCGGPVKPDVVLYEEGLDDKTLNAAVHYISTAQVLIIGGTSLAVYPAAGLINYFQGDKIVVINMSATPKDNIADLLIQAPIGEVFRQI